MQTVFNEDGEIIGTEYVRDQYEEEIAICEEMDMRAEDPLYAAHQENQRWYNIACSIFEERGIRVPEDVIRSLSRELRRKEAELEEKEALDRVQPVVDFLNKQFPDGDAEAYYYPETYDEIAQTEIHFNGKEPTRKEMEDILPLAYEKELCIEDYICLRYLR